VLGILIFSKVIDVAIKRAPSVSYYCVLGLVVGSTYGLWPKRPANTHVLVLVLAFAVGLALALVFGKPAPDKAPAVAESLEA